MEIIKSNVIDKIKSDAAKELQAEFEDKAKNLIKTKLRGLELAKKCVLSIERELEKALPYMLNYQKKQFLQSAPFKIVWAGFESDTLRLQKMDGHWL